MSNSRALRRIEKRLLEMAADADTAFTDPHDLRVVAAQVGAQAEQIELGLAGDD